MPRREKINGRTTKPNEHLLRTEMIPNSIEDKKPGDFRTLKTSVLASSSFSSSFIHIGNFAQHFSIWFRNQVLWFGCPVFLISLKEKKVRWLRRIVDAMSDMPQKQVSPRSKDG